MSATKHTPGPWRVEQDAAGRRTIRGERKVVTLDINTKDGDAALIVAAPELADALEATAEELATTREQLREQAAAYWKLEHPSGAGATYQCAAYECETPAADGSDYCEHHDPLSGDGESQAAARAALCKAGRLVK